MKRSKLGNLVILRGDFRRKKFQLAASGTPAVVFLICIATVVCLVLVLAPASLNLLMVSVARYLKL